MWLTKEMYELGQYWNVVTTTVTIGINATNVQLAKRNALRWSLYITLAGEVNTANRNLFIGPRVNPDVNNGVVLPSTAPGLAFNYRSDGGLVQIDWYASSNDAINPHNVIVTEVLLQQ